MCASRPRSIHREQCRGVNGGLVVVAHGLVCRAFVERHAPLPEGAVAPKPFDNTSVTVVHIVFPTRFPLASGIATCGA
jgi:broad specificity phosphatase PhoE